LNENDGSYVSDVVFVVSLFAQFRELEQERKAAARQAKRSKKDEKN